MAGITLEAVRKAMTHRFHQPLAYSACLRATRWTVEDHIARIAYLASTGWSEPIEVDVGVPHMNCWVNWPVVDGNHRLAAAIARRDDFILASVGGCCTYMRELFGRTRRCSLPSTS
ncbi:hypothetical protein [Ottowia sp.]|uniref:hypothetical protein n=1 Tax=Ottowia sp. TaxID=1898956 RepID=UPI0025DA9909|nr:hypothetical protein [Ottowia sp.]MBK6616279.1 hypothetical protein [Ottowia sp.]